MPELARIQGELWKGLSDAAKQVYVDKQAEDRSRYEREMAEAELPLVKERASKASAPRERPSRKRKKVVSDLSGEDDDDDDDEDEDVLSVGYIEWYVHDGFTLQEAPPGDTELAFTAEWRRERWLRGGGCSFTGRVSAGARAW